MDDELLEDQLDDDNDASGGDSGSDNSAPPDGEAQSDSADGKRVNDLMSNWQREQARANKLERELQALRAASQGNTQGQGTPGGASGAELDEFKEFARENARTTLYSSDPRLAEYGLKPEDIAGSTLAEMRASVKKHQSLIDGIETRARNRILAEHGLSPEVATGASTESTPKFSEMSDEEFDKFLAKRSGGSWGV